MAIRYKFDILEKLKEIGYTSYKLRREKIFGERVIQQLRNGEIVSWKTIEILCSLLSCQVGDLVEFIETDTNKVQEEAE